MSFNEINGDLKASNPITIMIGLFRFDVMIQILEDFIVCGGKKAIVVAGRKCMVKYLILFDLQDKIRFLKLLA